MAWRTEDESRGTPKENAGASSVTPGERWKANSSTGARTASSANPDRIEPDTNTVSGAHGIRKENSFENHAINLAIPSKRIRAPFARMRPFNSRAGEQNNEEPHGNSATRLDANLGVLEHNSIRFDIGRPEQGRDQKEAWDPQAVETSTKKTEFIWGPEEEFWDEIPAGSELEKWSYELSDGNLNLYFGIRPLKAVFPKLSG